MNRQTSLATRLGATARLVLFSLTLLSANFARSNEPPTPANSPAGAVLAEPDTIPTRHLLGILKDGGVLMVPILFCSFVLVVFVFERTVSLRRGRVIPGPFVKRFLHQLREGELDRESALEICAQNGSPIAEVFAAATKKWGRPTVEVEQAALDAGERAVNRLRRYLRVLNGVATVSPLQDCSAPCLA